MTNIVNTLQKYKKRPIALDEAMASYTNYLKETQLDDIQGLFNFRLLGMRADR